jgi:hypothetical protein
MQRGWVIAIAMLWLCTATCLAATTDERVLKLTEDNYSTSKSSSLIGDSVFAGQWDGPKYVQWNGDDPSRAILLVEMEPKKQLPTAVKIRKDLVGDAIQCSWEGDYFVIKLQKPKPGKYDKNN